MTMPRYYNPRSNQDVGVPYVSFYDPDFNNNLIQLLAQKQARYDTANQALNEYKSQIAGASVNPYDRPHIEKQLARDTEEIKSLVKNEFDGDYGAALNRLSNEITNRKSYYIPAIQRYGEEQKIDPVLRELDAQGKLIFKNGVDPRKVSIYNEEGKFSGMPDFNSFVARPDYGDVIYNDIGKAIDQMVVEGKLQAAEKPWLLANITQRGLNAITNQELKSRINNYVGEFEKKTPFTYDPKYANYKGNTSKFIEEVLRDRVSNGTTREYRENPTYNVNPTKDSGDGGAPFNFPTMPVTYNDKSQFNDLEAIEKKLQNVDENLKNITPLNPIAQSQPDSSLPGQRAGLPGQPYKGTDKVRPGEWVDPRVGGATVDQDLVKNYNIQESAKLNALAEKFKYMPGANKKEQILNGIRLEKAKTTRQYNAYNFNPANEEVMRNYISFGLDLVPGKDAVLTEIKSNGNKGSEINGEKARQILFGVDASGKVNGKPGRIYSNGRDGLIITSGDKTYKIDSNILPKQVRGDVEMMVKLNQEAFDYSTENISKGNKKNQTKELGRDSEGNIFVIKTNATHYNPTTNSYAPAKYLTIYDPTGKIIHSDVLSSYDDIVNDNGMNTSAKLNQLESIAINSIYSKTNTPNPGVNSTISVFK